MDNLIRHSYRCPRPDCKNPELWSYSENGLDTIIELHKMSHRMEDTRNAAKQDSLIEKRKNAFDYNKLVLNWQDIAFLVSRHISIDEDIVYVGYSGKYNQGTV